MSSDRTTTFLQSLHPLHHLPSQIPKHNPINNTGQIAIEEAKIEKAIIEAITRGKVQTLKPNSGEAIPIGEHYICVSFQDEAESECRVWEWHGHIMSYNGEQGYTQDYVYGNYFERMTRRVFSDESDEKGDVGLGLRELIGGINSMGGGILCRNMNFTTSDGMAVGFHDDLPERTAFATKTGSFCNLEAGDFRKF
ncbi:hypothetical protein AAG906_032800 [Vitis piasezkii]